MNILIYLCALVKIFAVSKDRNILNLDIVPLGYSNFFPTMEGSAYVTSFQNWEGRKVSIISSLDYPMPMVTIAKTKLVKVEIFLQAVIMCDTKNIKIL